MEVELNNENLVKQVTVLNTLNNRKFKVRFCLRLVLLCK